MNYNFEWNPRKAGQNARKHGVTFQRAATVFSNPYQISLLDESHRDDEERWLQWYGLQWDNPCRCPYFQDHEFKRCKAADHIGA